MAKPKVKASPKNGLSKPRVAKLGGSKPTAPKAGLAKSRAAAKPPNSAAKQAVARPVAVQGGAERLERLWTAVQQVRDSQRDSPRTTRLLAGGAPKLAQKVVEEAAEVAIEAVIGNRDALINESVDLLYNLVVLWNGLGVELSTIWAEMDRREAALGMAEKLPKSEDV